MTTALFVSLTITVRCMQTYQLKNIISMHIMYRSLSILLMLMSLVKANDWWNEFHLFQTTFQRKYHSLDELEHRFRIFAENAERIHEHNSNKTHPFSLKINQFTDLTHDEFASQMRLVSTGVPTYGCSLFQPNALTSVLPSAIDWRELNAVTSVKDQGQCGSCWTFSATGAIEGAWAISTKKLVNLSEQELVDCARGVTYGSHGCDGGEMTGAFKYVIKNGQCADDEYPYHHEETKGGCKDCKSVAYVRECKTIEPKNQLSLQHAVAIQPVSVAIDAGSSYFQSYGGGIITDEYKCGSELNHGVLVVGYGVERGQMYWLVKNSWGTSWGDNGYVKIGRTNSTNDSGVCGIALSASFPVV